jgi:EPS-associated MarR family transcriptional regulator
MTNQELKYRALKLLEQCPQTTQRELASELGVSLGKTHYLLKSLVQVGWIKLENFKRSNNKLGYAYLLTPAGVLEKAKITRQFLRRKEKDYQQLAQEIRQLKDEVSRF